jgi:hypothetical protein
VRPVAGAGVVALRHPRQRGSCGDYSQDSTAALEYALAAGRHFCTWARRVAAMVAIMYEMPDPRKARAFRRFNNNPADLASIHRCSVVTSVGDC